jgi:hypothetical protein
MGFLNAIAHRAGIKVSKCFSFFFSLFGIIIFFVIKKDPTFLFYFFGTNEQIHYKEESVHREGSVRRTPNSSHPEKLVAKQISQKGAIGSTNALFFPHTCK